MDTLTKYNTTEAAKSATPAAYTEFLRNNFGPAAQEIEKYYALSLFESAPAPVVAAIATVITDAEFKCPGYQSAVQATYKGVPAWIYEFTHNSTCVWLDTMPPGDASYFGAAHTAEIPYVFGNLHFDFQNTTCIGTDAEHGLSKQMMSLWTAMAEQGSPSTQQVHWPPFQITTQDSGTPALIFGNSSVPGTIDFSACGLWAQVDAMLTATNSNATESSGSAGKPTDVPANSGARISFFTAGTFITLSMLLLAALA